MATFKNILIGLGITLGLVIIGAIGYGIYVVRQWLPLVGEFLLIALVLSVLGAMAYGLIELHHRLHIRRLQRHEFEVSTVMRTMQDGQWIANVMQQTVLAAPQPVTVQALPQTAPMQLPAPLQQSNALPYAPPFSAVRPLIQPGRLVLGYSADGPVWGDVGDLLSMAFAGMPGTGKSSALLYFIAILALVKAKTHVIDPHGSLNELSSFLSYCDDPAELHTFLPDLYTEFERRKMLWKRSRTTLDPYLVLVDELPVIARYEQKHQGDYSLLELAETIVLEGRKLNMFCILAGQSFPATVLPTLTRDNLSSRIVFNSKEMHAKMAGLDKESRQTLLPLLRKAQPGTAILDVARKADPCIVSLPFTTMDDLRDVVESVPDVPGVPLRSSSYGNTVPPLVEPFPLFPRNTEERRGTAKNSVSEQERERIIALHQEGVPRREMCTRLGKGKGYYDTIKMVLNEYQTEMEA